MSGFRCQFCKGSLTKVHYPKLYNMAHLLSLNVFTASEGSNNYILFIKSKYFYAEMYLYMSLFYDNVILQSSIFLVRQCYCDAEQSGLVLP